MASRALALSGLGALAAGTALMVALHVLPSTDGTGVLRRTISQYALGPNKWVFDVSVLFVAAGSALGFAELVRRRLVRPLSPVVLFAALWTVSLLVVVAFTKNDWSVGPSVGGMVHRYASVVGFVALPLAVLPAARAAFPSAPGWRLAASGFGLVTLGGFIVLLIGVLRMAAGGGPWWLFVPLGLVERVMAVGAVAAIAVLVAGVLVVEKSGDALEPAV